MKNIRMNLFIKKTKDEVELIRKSSLLVSDTLALIAGMIKPGITTLELDKKAEEFIRDSSVNPLAAFGISARSKKTPADTGTTNSDGVTPTHDRPDNGQ